jgi:hypothetical protein
MCVGHLITKTIIEMAQRAHFPFNLPLYGDLCQHIQKATKRSATSMQLKIKLSLLMIRHIWNHSLETLGLFLQIKFFFLSLSQTYLFGQIERYSKRKFDQMLKTPPFPIIKILPHKRPNFAIRVSWTNYKF